MNFVFQLSLAAQRLLLDTLLMLWPRLVRKGSQWDFLTRVFITDYKPFDADPCQHTMKTGCSLKRTAGVVHEIVMIAQVAGNSWGPWTRDWTPKADKLFVNTTPKPVRVSTGKGLICWWRILVACSNWKHTDPNVKNEFPCVLNQNGKWSVQFCFYWLFWVVQSFI